jgi:hypothetical protein
MWSVERVDVTKVDTSSLIADVEAIQAHVRHRANEAALLRNNSKFDVHCCPKKIQQYRNFKVRDAAKQIVPPVRLGTITPDDVPYMK